MKGQGKTYGRAFRKIAKKIADYLGSSVIDQLGNLVKTQKPKPVKLVGKTSRDRAMDTIKRKYKL